jgi:peptide/nickel transport system substrate-binding protein
MKLTRAIALVAALALLVAACGDNGTTTTTQPAGTETTAPATTAPSGTETTAPPATTAPAASGGTLNVSRFESFDGWVLDSAAAYVSYNTHQAVIEPLLRFAADGESIEPGLAETWDYDPEVPSITFTLWEGAAFSNGDPVTAEDVEFSLGVWNEGVNFAGSWDSIVSVTGEGREIVVELAYADNTILPVLASSISGIHPKDFAGMTADEYYNNPIGAGAFTVDEWSIGGRIVLEKNPNYHREGRPYVDEVVLEVITDLAENQILFEAGDIQIIEYIAPTVTSQYDPADIYVAPIHSLEHLAMNVLRPPFDDQNLRKAVAYAVDYDAVSAGLGGHYGPPSGVLSPNIWNWAPPTEPYFRRDLDKAREFLAQSAYPDGVEVELIFDSGNAGDVLIAQVLQANLAEIGITVTLGPLETGAFLDRAFTVDADMTIWNYGAISPTISDPFIWIAATEWLFSGWETDTLWDLYFVFAEATTDEEMQALSTEVQDLSFTEAHAIGIAEGSYTHAVSQDLTGFESAPWGLYYYDTIAIGG